MELDSRILKGKTYLDCYDTEVAKKFIGKECYLSDGVASFANIDNLNKATLMKVDDRDMRPYKLETTRGHYGAWSPFILPCEWIKPEEPEKKYRPFTLEEFLKIFDIGDQIGFRSKDNGEVKHAMFVGYTDDFFADNTDRSDGENDVMIGIYRFSLSYLFDNYELLLEDGWQPFGVIDEDKE